MGGFAYKQSANALVDLTVQRFNGVAEAIAANSVVTLDTNLLMVQEANTLNSTLFGQNAAGAGTAVDKYTYANAGMCLLTTLPNGDSIYAEQTRPQSGGTSGRNLHLVSADGDLKLTVAFSGSAGGDCFAVHPDGRLFLAKYTGPAQAQLLEFSSTTLQVVNTYTLNFTGGSTSPMGNSSGLGGCEFTSNGQLVMTWGIGGSNGQYYAVLNADFTIKTNPTSVGSYTSSYAFQQTLRTSTGQVVMLYSYFDGSQTVYRFNHFDANGNYVRTIMPSYHGFNSDYTCHYRQTIDRKIRSIVEVGTDVIGWLAYNSVTSLVHYQSVPLSTGVLSGAPAVTSTLNPCTLIDKKDGYVYVFSHRNSPSYDLQYIVFNAATGAVVSALQNLKASWGNDNFIPRFVFNVGDDFYVLGCNSNTASTKILCYGVTLKAGIVTYKNEKVILTDNGRIQDAILFGSHEVHFLYGGDNDGNGTFYALKSARYNVATGTFITSVQVRAHESGNTGYGGLNNYPCTKTMFRQRSETCYLFGPGVNTTATYSRVPLKPITSIVLGTAYSSASGNSVLLKLAGWVQLASKYSNFYKTIDHTAQNGNKMKCYGAAAYLQGTF